MGCGSSSSSSSKDQKVSKDRRRLSDTGQEEPGGAALDPATQEENRGLIAKLEKEDITKLISTSGRKMSIGSHTDAVTKEFTEKSVDKGGETDMLATSQGSFLGYTCRKGLKPDSPNQDSWFILQLENEMSIYAVFDGHGQQGHQVSDFVKAHLPKLVIGDPRLKTDLQSCLKDSFRKAQSLVTTADRVKKLQAQMSGTTVTMVVHEHTADVSRLTFAHCADSTAVLGGWKDSSKSALEVVHHTRDHKPNLPDEKKRIEAAGGKVIFDGYQNHRVYAAPPAKYPGLNMSRCMGDLKGHSECGLSADPEVKVIDINPNHHVLLICSDGVWEFIQPLEAVQFVGKQPPGRAMQTAEELAKKAYQKWIQEEGEVVDDITVILVYLNVGSSSA
jgi:serine/threonine protein phosphatase PrpC